MYKYLKACLYNCEFCLKVNLFLMFLVVHGKKREAPVSRDRVMDTSHKDDVGMAPPSDHGGGALSTGKSREVKVQDIPTVLTFMQSKFFIYLKQN